MIYNPATQQIESIHTLRQQFPNTSFPSQPDSETLSMFERVLIQPTEPPEGDVVTQGQPEEIEGVWYQTWISRDFTPEELDEQLDQRKQGRLSELDALRDAAFAAGMPYQFSDGDDVVQTRQQDQINLMGLAAKAQRQLVEGDDTLLPFRALSNQTRMLTPAETDAMALAALAHIEGIYGRTWLAKDAIEAAETVEAVLAVEW